MKLLSLVFISILLAACSGQQQSEQTAPPSIIKVAVDSEVGNTLSGFPGLDLVVVDDIARPLLDGQATVAISREKLSDDVMGRFAGRFGEHPVMTIFTAPLPQDENQRLALERGEKTINKAWFLYRIKTNTDVLPESERQQLIWLYSDDVQQQLADRGLLSLPEPLRQRARVALSLEPPMVPGGYR